MPTVEELLGCEACGTTVWMVGNDPPRTFRITQLCDPHVPDGPLRYRPAPTPGGAGPGVANAHDGGTADPADR